MRKLIDISLCKDKEAAKRYNTLYEEVYSHPDVFYSCPNGKKVNLMGFTVKVRKWLTDNGVTGKEHARLIKVNKEIQVKLRELAQLKRKAFGGRNILEIVKTEVFELFGRLYSEEEIQKNLEERGVPVHVEVLRRFKHQHKHEIKKMQDEYESDWRSVTVSRKRSRLDQLSYIYSKNKQEFDKSSGKNQLPFSREMRAVLEQVRKEVEGEMIKLTVDGKLDITTTVELNKTTEELYSQINFLALLVGRVSAQLGVNPLVLQHRLTNSWYKRFTGIMRHGNKVESLIPNYPSSIVYNWDTVKDNYEKKQSLYKEMEKSGELTDAEVIEESKVQKDTLKDLMVKRLKQMENGKSK